MTITSHGPSFSRGSGGRPRPPPSAAGRAAARSTRTPRRRPRGRARPTSICTLGKSRQVALRRRAAAEPDVEHPLRAPAGRRPGAGDSRSTRSASCTDRPRTCRSGRSCRSGGSGWCRPRRRRSGGTGSPWCGGSCSRSACPRSSPSRSSGACWRYTGDQFRSCEADTVAPDSGASETTAPTLAPASASASAKRDRQPLDERHRSRGEHQRDGGRGEHLVGAELRDQPERGQERPGDRAGRRDREQPAGGPAQVLERPRLQADGDRRNRAEDDARDPEEEDRGDERVEARPGIPVDDAVEHPAVDERDREHEQSTGPEQADEQPRLRPAVGDRASEPVAGRQACEHDADQRSPDVERVAEVTARARGSRRSRARAARRPR